MIDCVGCGEKFVSHAAFTLHAFGRLDPPSTDRRRCRSIDELHRLGMRRNSARVWYMPNGKQVG